MPMKRYCPMPKLKHSVPGDPRIKERMDLDVEVSRLRLMRAEHQNNIHRLEDQIVTTFPAKIEQDKRFIASFEADIEAELSQKEARLIELDTKLNLDSHSPPEQVIEKSEAPTLRERLSKALSKKSSFAYIDKKCRMW